MDRLACESRWHENRKRTWLPRRRVIVLNLIFPRVGFRDWNFTVQTSSPWLALVLGFTRTAFFLLLTWSFHANSKKMSIQRSRLQDIKAIHAPLDAMETARTEPYLRLQRCGRIMLWLCWSPLSSFSLWAGSQSYGTAILRSRIIFLT